jgi:hypothetical protein
VFAQFLRVKERMNDINRRTGGEQGDKTRCSNDRETRGISKRLRVDVSSLRGTTRRNQHVQAAGCITMTFGMKAGIEAATSGKQGTNLCQLGSKRAETSGAPVEHPSQGARFGVPSMLLVGSHP